MQFSLNESLLSGHGGHLLHNNQSSRSTISHSQYLPSTKEGILMRTVRISQRIQLSFYLLAYSTALRDSFFIIAAPYLWFRNLVGFQRTGKLIPLHRIIWRSICTIFRIVFSLPLITIPINHRDPAPRQ